MDQPPFHPNCRCELVFDEGDRRQRFLDEVSELCDQHLGYTDPSMEWLASIIYFVHGRIVLSPPTAI